jgi:SAM-dependent methyltransferase
MTTTTTPAIDQERLDAILGQFVADLGAALSAPLIVLGERLGLFAAMADGEPVTPGSLAGRTQTRERYVREWLAAMSASGYVTYDEAADAFHLTPEQALTFAQPDGPAYLPGAFELAAACVKDEPHIERVFRTGEGFGWHEHDHDLFHGTERFFRPGYAAHLAAEWIPALDGVEDKLHAGALVADLGCGHGASTILMAQAYPASSFVGSDYHEASIEHARRAAERAGVADRVRFEVATADAFTGEQYDLACIFDALHDMGDPVGAARHVRRALAPDGTWLVVEPIAGDTLTDNLNPVGRIFYAASTSLCVPNALSQGGHRALGAQAGEAQLRVVLEEAGFSRVRRAAQTPFNLVLEARP